MITRNDLLWTSIAKSYEWADEQDWTGYTKEQRKEMTIQKSTEIYRELEAKYGFRW